MIKIFKLNELDLVNMTFMEHRNNIIRILHNDKHPIFFETPELFCIDKINVNKTKYSTHELLIALVGLNNTNTEIIINFFKTLDNKFIDYGKKNINIWPFTDKSIIFTSTIRQIDIDSLNYNNCYDNGSLKMKFIKNEKFNTLAFDKNNNTIETSDYDKYFIGNIYVKLIFEVASIWIKDNIYGLYLKLHKIKIVNTEQKLLNNISNCNMKYYLENNSDNNLENNSDNNLEDNNSDNNLEDNNSEDNNSDNNPDNNSDNNSDSDDSDDININLSKYYNEKILNNQNNIILNTNNKEDKEIEDFDYLMSDS